MFAGGRLARALGSIQYGVELDEDAARKQLIHVGQELVANGIAIVINHAGTKHPMCTLTAAEKKAADQWAKDDAAAKGDQFFHKRVHACGLAHAITDAKTATRVLTRMARRERFNLGIEPRKSGLMIVDLDTTEQKDAYAACARSPRLALTVASPGSRDSDGNWVHRDGGHIHYEVPDDCELPVDEGIYTHPDGWTTTWGEHQVLVPPSVRAEGSYVLVGGASPLPGWLREVVMNETAGKRKRRAEATALRERSGPSAIDDWAGGHGWPAILLADGWIETGLTKSCGCPQWTAPGEHASPESATAHEPGCSTYVCERGHGPLHVWTDNPSEGVRAAIEAFGHKTLTMAQVLTYTEGGGNMRATLRELGLPEIDGPAVRAAGFSTWDRVGELERELDDAVLGDPAPPRDAPTPPLTDADPDDETGTDQDEDDSDEERAQALAEYEERQIQIEATRLRRQREAQRRIEAEGAPALRVLRGEGFLAAPRPEPLVSQMLYRDSLARIYGAPGSGKSFVALDIALSIALGKWWNGVRMTAAPVVYVMAEGQAVNADRTEAWLSKHGAVLDENFIVVPDAVMLTEFAARDLVALVEHEQPVLVVLDTKNAMMIGEENSATDFAALRRTLDLIRKAAGACVVLVDHTGYEGTRARGSSAGTAAMDTEIRVEKDDSSKPSIVTAEVTRDKASEAGTAWTWNLIPEHPAAVLVAPPEGVGVGIVDADKPQWRDESTDGLPAWIEHTTGKNKIYLVELARYMRFETSAEQDPSGHGRTQAQAVVDLKPPTNNKRVVDAWRTGMRRAWSKLKAQGCIEYWDLANGGTDLQERSGAHVWRGPDGS